MEDNGHHLLSPPMQSVSKWHAFDGQGNAMPCSWIFPVIGGNASRLEHVFLLFILAILWVLTKRDKKMRICQERLFSVYSDAAYPLDYYSRERLNAVGYNFMETLALVCWSSRSMFHLINLSHPSTSLRQRTSTNALQASWTDGWLWTQWSTFHILTLLSTDCHQWRSPAFSQPVLLYTSCNNLSSKTATYVSQQRLRCIGLLHQLPYSNAVPTVLVMTSES